MRMHHAMGCCVAAGSLVLGACQPWHAAHEPEPDGPRVVAVWRDEGAAGHFDISSGALVRRHEAQAELDAARAALRADAPARAARALHTAAAFFAGHAVRPAAGGRADLVAAAVAWAQQQRTDTGDELVMAVDHLERALADGGRPVAPSTRRLLTTARAEACTLMRADDPGAAQIDTSLAGLAAVIATR